jgi:hypothetical protein
MPLLSYVSTPVIDWASGRVLCYERRPIQQDMHLGLERSWADKLYRTVLGRDR